MKKLAILMAVVASGFVGCTKQGGTDDQYDSTTGGSRSGTSTTTNNTSPTPNSTDTNSSTTTPSSPSRPQ